jgi:hypothetical protein
VARRLPAVWLVCVAGVLAPATLLAQWPAVRSAASRTADGRVDLLAPAPRAPDGKPDLSGIWDKGLLPNEVPPPGPFSGIGPSQAFRDLRAALPGELPMLPWAVQLKATRFGQNSKDHPDAHCLPLHPIQLHLHPQPRKMVQTPSLVVMLYEANDGRREIFLDGRTLPGGDVQPWWYGYSVGRWEGDTLVVESAGFKGESWIDEHGTPAGERLKLVERFRRPNLGTLEIQMTVDDPGTFTRPFTFTIQQRLMPDTDLIEFVCGENNLSAKRLVGN